MVKLEKEKTVPSGGPAQIKAISEFIERKLDAFNNRRAFEPVIEKVEGKEREILWRWYLNHFFFIERGQWLADNANGNYMSLISCRNGQENELLIVNTNLKPTWRILSTDSAKWGENWLADVPAEEPLVITSMINYLFARDHMKTDIADPDMTDEV